MKAGQQKDSKSIWVNNKLTHEGPLPNWQEVGALWEEPYVACLAAQCVAYTFINLRKAFVILRVSGWFNPTGKPFWVTVAT